MPDQVPFSAEMIVWEGLREAERAAAATDRKTSVALAGVRYCVEQYVW